jgi:endoglucanase
MKRIVPILILTLLFAGVTAQKHLPLIKVDGKNIVTEKGQVIQLRGVCFSDPDKLEKDGHWNKQYFQEAKNWGCNVVRFAIHPSRLNSRGWDKYFELVDKGVVMAEELGMYVIIDWHSIGNLNEDKYTNAQYNTSWAETVKFWKTVAQRYKGNPTVAVYELFNEPTKAGGTLTWGTWRPSLEKIIDEIYTIDDQKISLVGGMDWAYLLNEVGTDPVNRKNVAYCTHPYPQKRNKSWEPQWEKDWGFVTDKYPIIATEFGFMDAKDRGAHIPCISDESYGKEIIDYFNKKNISYTSWCFDPNWPPYLIKDWNFTPTVAGEIFRKAMLEKTK